MAPVTIHLRRGMPMMYSTTFLLFLIGAALAAAFSPQQTRSVVSSHVRSAAALYAKPTFNKSTQKWVAPADDEPSYGPFGSFLRGGPTPALVRVLTPDDYEQAVLKYMATDGCSRMEAQGNMDAFFNNAADWQYQKMEEKKGAPKVDYTKLKPKQAILVLTWAFFITPVILRIAYIAAVTGNTGVKIEDIFNFN